MGKRLTSALACLILLLLAALSPAAAEVEWKENTPAQRLLKNYIAEVNACLKEKGEREINRLFEIYERFAELGITESDSAETPEGVEITVNLLYDSINNLELRVNDPERFAVIAAAFLRALDPENITFEQAYTAPAKRAQKAISSPQDSFEDEVEELNGASPRAYYAYYPNRYHDGVSWMTMTIIFPLKGEWEGGKVLEGETPTRGPDNYSDHDEEYEGYYSSDDYYHLEYFTTPTPEPDSAAAEYDFR